MLTSVSPVVRCTVATLSFVDILPSQICLEALPVLGRAGGSLICSINTKRIALQMERAGGYPTLRLGLSSVWEVVFDDVHHSHYIGEE